MTHPNRHRAPQRDLASTLDHHLRHVRSRLAHTYAYRTLFSLQRTGVVALMLYAPMYSYMSRCADTRYISYGPTWDFVGLWLLVSLFACWRRRGRVWRESLLVVHDLGLQVRRQYFSGKQDYRFVERGCIQGQMGVSPQFGAGTRGSRFLRHPDWLWLPCRCYHQRRRRVRDCDLLPRGALSEREARERTHPHT